MLSALYYTHHVSTTKSRRYLLVLFVSFLVGVSENTRLAAAGTNPGESEIALLSHLNYSLVNVPLPVCSGLFFLFILHSECLVMSYC